MNYPSDTFDYIVIGAGSAGSLIAHELSKDPNAKILVLESGSRASHRFSRVPATYPRLFSNSNLCSATSTTLQVGLSKRRIPLPRGIGLGGSSLINAMIWIPPHPQDLLRWHRQSDGGWSVEQMQHALTWVYRSYMAAGADLCGQTDLHQDHPTFPCWCNHETNPMHRTDSVHQLVQSLNRFLAHDAARPASQTLVTSPGYAGFYSRATSHGQRLSAWKVFGNRPRPTNLTVARGYSALEIVFEGQKAIGVIAECDELNSRQQLHATKAVILSAGAIASPALLQRSGIGDVDHLQECRINPRVINSNVGENLQDHLIFPIIYRHTKLPFPSRPSREQWSQAIRHGIGPMTSNIAEAGGFFKLHSANASSSNSSSGCGELSLPEFQWHFTPTHYLEYPLREEPTAAISVGVTPLHPRSRGYVRITPTSDILIDPQYLSNDTDREDFVKGVQGTRLIINELLDELNISDEILPGSKRQTDEQVMSCLSRFATTLYHYVGTCAVGEEGQSVCNSRFEVRGTENLYVCDGSVLPSLPSGNSQVTVMMLAKMFIETLRS